MIMHEMIERVANVIENMWHKPCAAIDVAKAAIEAMREPTEPMVRAGIHFATLERDHLAEEGVPEIWRAMIDEVLK
jgi:hypothetical protein